MGIEKVEYNIKVYDNIIELTPVNGVLDNSIYEIRLKDIKQLNGPKVLQNKTIKICTELSPCYATIDDVNSYVESCNIEGSTILYHIRAASKFAEYVTKKTYKKDGIPFEVNQFVIMKAAHECLLKYYIDKASTHGMKGQLGDIVYDTSGKLDDLSNLLKAMKAEIAVWTDAMKGYNIEGRARPLTARKSSYIINPRISNDNPPRRTDWGGY
jgi:hypothetical protein